MKNQYTPAEAEQLTAEGEFYERCRRLAERLEKDENYSIPKVYLNSIDDWPGDWPGRTLLAKAMLYRVLSGEKGRDTDLCWQIRDDMDEMMIHYREAANEKGYLGKITDKTDEQQLAGHSWFLRGLCEYYKITGNPEALRILVDIIRELYVPAEDAFRSYTTVSTENGAYSGNLLDKADGCWLNSTDTGCAFIALDGLTAAEELVRQDPALRDLVDGESLHGLIHVMTDRFLQLDITGLRMQTHATLTALRGLLRAYGLEENEQEKKRILTEVEKRYRIYLDEGMDAVYANYNWFGRPDWTEPCAIIDSYMIAMQLFQHTGDSFYLQTGNRIGSAVLHAQRANGGFGCDTCVGAAKQDGTKVDLLKVSTYEAYWCCTMRGGEGLARILENQFFENEKGVWINPFPVDASFRMKGHVLRKKVMDGGIDFSISGSSESRPRIFLLHADWMKDVTGTGCRIKKTDGGWEIIPEQTQFNVRFPIHLQVERPCGEKNVKDAFLIFYRSGILGSSEGKKVNAGSFVRNARLMQDADGTCFEAEGVVLRELDESWKLEKDGQTPVYTVLME